MRPILLFIATSLAGNSSLACTCTTADDIGCSTDAFEVRLTGPALPASYVLEVCVNDVCSTSDESPGTSRVRAGSDPRLVPSGRLDQDGTLVVDATLTPELRQDGAVLHVRVRSAADGSLVVSWHSDPLQWQTYSPTECSKQVCSRAVPTVVRD